MFPIYLTSTSQRTNMNRYRYLQSPCCILALALSLSLSGCGSSSDETESLEPAAKKVEVANVTVAFQSLQRFDASTRQEEVKLKGAGASFPEPLYQALFKSLRENSKTDVRYEAVGSSAGTVLVQNKQVNFGASDAPLTDEQMKSDANGAILHIPTAFGAVSVVYNLPGVNAVLKLSAEQLALIYLGRITYWDDERLVAGNAELKGVHERIISVHRADGSGSTFALTEFLAEGSGDWNKQMGKGTSMYWPGGMAVTSGGAMVDAVLRSPYAIGYTDLNVAVSRNLKSAALKNPSGAYVVPSFKSVREAMEGLAASDSTDLRLDVINSDGSGSYPISTATYVLVYQNQDDPKQAQALTQVLWWLVHDGQAAHEKLLYVPLSANLVKRVEKALEQLRANGAPVLTPVAAQPAAKS